MEPTVTISLQEYKSLIEVKDEYEKKEDERPQLAYTSGFCTPRPHRIYFSSNEEREVFYDNLVNKMSELIIGDELSADIRKYHSQNFLSRVLERLKNTKWH